MKLSRRNLIASGAAASVASLIPKKTLAELSIGSATITTVSDGSLTLPASFIFEPMPQDQLAPILAKHGISGKQLIPECNLALYRDGTNTVLFDVGSGPDFMPTAGKTVDSLGLIGLAPEDITHVVFTHAHPDHIWGLLDEFDEFVFYNATYLMGRSEWDYWWNPETVTQIGEGRAAFAVGAKRRMQAIENAVELIDDGKEILPGIAAHATPGHTPGHMAFEIRVGSVSAMVIGDAIGNHHVGFSRPDWHSGSDQDPEKAAETRIALFDRLVSEDIAIVGFHLPDGGMGRAVKDGAGYRFVAEDL